MCLGEKTAVANTIPCIVSPPVLLFADQLLKDGLVLNKSLKELDLTGCALTDPGAKLVVQVLKVHSPPPLPPSACSG